MTIVQVAKCKSDNSPSRKVTIVTVVTIVQLDNAKKVTLFFNVTFIFLDVRNDTYRNKRYFLTLPFVHKKCTIRRKLLIVKVTVLKVKCDYFDY